jgi:hypothetical protein
LWSRSAGCYQLKAALGWLEISEESGEPGFRAQYERLLDYSLRTHTRFLTIEPGRERVMDRLHAYCYFLEGLLPYAERREIGAVLAGGIDTVAGLLEQIAPVFERSDVAAQLLRLRLFADALGAAPLNAVAAEREAARIAAFAIDDAAPRLQGGVWFGRKGCEMLAYVNPVSTAFAAQALELWRDYRLGRFEPDWRELI